MDAREPDTPQPRRRRFRSKLAVLCAFWLVQAVVVYVFSAGIPVFTATGASLLSRASWGEFADVLTDRGLILVMTVYLPGLVVLQGLLLQAVHKPVPIRERGESLLVSVVVAALAVAGLWMAAFLSVVSAIYLATSGETKWMDPLIDGVGLGEVGWVVMLVPLLAGWGVATPLLWAYCRSRRRETALAKIATRLLQGTVVEVVAIIPLDVMVRRRTNCYCDTGTFWALILCGTVGVIVAGPAVFLTILSKRRRRWYMGRCESCGYDMSGTPKADRCPECGCGWASAPAPLAGPG